ncbi:serine hydrolase [Microbacterium sp. SLBN-146]|uniref:serine hydrolase domain-containing protein n=1 Tax=Microbacterium sp. SLBN-146 TaxID=2768457 RepID=UPI0011541443|nr:serine hydrolase domain-containing protein [Microbacterium sp. SLBN-146]TQJ30266.1 D-alanyl-D-alanine carboxypeptidase [Microbacterium sp. SLBN-146]
MRRGTARRRIAATIAVALASALALAACTGSPDGDIDQRTQVEGAFPEETQTQLEAAVTHAMGATGSSGAIVGVWAPWSGSWVAGLGTQTPGGAAVTADMAFRAAQVTRPMTCDLLYRAAADGLVELDDPVSQWVSGVADLDDVTLQQLCDGTSGIGTYATQLSPLWTSNPARSWNPRELASYGLGQPRVSEPGVAYRPTDTGYVLLGLALERAMGDRAAVLIREYIAEPLGLTGTRLPSGKAAAPEGAGGTLTGQKSVPGEDGTMNCAAPLDVTTMSASIGYTDSGVVSTVHDLGRYAQALAAGITTPSAFADDRFSDPKPFFQDAPSWMNAAGGAVLFGSLVGNYGTVPGYATAAFSDTESGLTVVVVLNNSANGASPAGNLAWEMAAIASKAPAASGQVAPEAGLPWTPQQFHDSIAAEAVCTPPAE